MRRRQLLSSIPLLLLAFLGSQITVPRVHAQLTGTVCIADQFSTDCSSTPVAISAVNGTRLEVAVNIQASDPLNGFDITIKADPSTLTGVSINLTGSVLGTNLFKVAECLGITGYGCSGGGDGPGAVRLAAVALGSVTPSPTTGRLFSVVFNATKTSPNVTVGFQTGCTGTSTTANYCVTVVNGFTGTVNRESVQESNGAIGDFSIVADICCSAISRNTFVLGIITVQSLNGFFGSISLTYSITPLRRQGPSAFSYTSDSILLLPDTSARILYAFTTSPFTPAGNYTIHIQAKAGTLVRTVTTQIRVVTNTAPPPSPPPTSVLAGTPNLALGFNGLDSMAERQAGTGLYNNTQFTHEPPDQALCAGNGYVIEAVNSVVQAFDRQGRPLTLPTPITQFLRLPPEVNLGPPRVLGNILSDPRCYFDNQTSRFFFTVLHIDVNSTDGSLGRAHLEIAVSQSPDPSADWFHYSIDVTDDGNNGTPSHTGCPCFGDQPLIGADANGFYITTNEFSLKPIGEFVNGAQLYAMSKNALVNGIRPSIVQISVGSIPTPSLDGVRARWASIQPATTPPGDFFASGQGGTEFFLSSLDFNGTVDNRIALWALTNTRSLDKPSPTVQLSLQVLTSELYSLPNPAVQKDGPRPLGTSLLEPVSLIDSNDDRMNQVVYSNGLLWGSLNTDVTRGDTDTVGIAYFIISPKVSSKIVTGKIISQGYIAPQTESAMFPSITVTASGIGVIAYDLVGPDYYPSGAYSLLTIQGIDGIHVAATGSAPEDGFSGYPGIGRIGISRWGDYSAAVTDNNGSIWIATEYIPDAPRTTLANWGTFIGKLV